LNEITHSESVEASLLSLDRLDKAHLELGEQMFEAFGGAMYGMDLLAAGALNRSKALEYQITHDEWHRPKA